LRRERNYTLPKAILLVLIIFISATRMLAQTPVANFTASPISGCSPLIVNFQNLSSANSTSWNWDFGNSNTSTLKNPAATYFAPGTYTVKLTAINAAGQNTLTRTQYITVYEPPTVSFTGTPTAGCFPLKVTFTESSTPGAGNTNVAWAWDFGDGKTSTARNPTTTYQTSGSFTVTLKVTNDKGCTRTVSKSAFINVNNGVTASFTNSQATVCSAPASISFTNTSTGPPTLSYQWDFGDGSPLDFTQNPVHVFNTNGSFTVTLITRSTAGCEDTARTAVPIVIGGYNNSFSGPTSICVNESLTFTNTSTPAVNTTTWNLGDASPIASGISVTHSYSAPGSYTVWMYNSFAACRDSVSKVIQVNPRPKADFTAPITSKCKPPLVVNFQDLSTGGATGWKWDFGDGSPTSNQQNPTHTYNAYGAFDVTLIATNGFGCTDTLKKIAFIKVQKAVIDIPLLPIKGCIPFTINPIANVTAIDNVVTWEWDFGDGSPLDNNQNPTHTYPNQGSYDVRLVITTSTGCQDTLKIIKAVRVGSKPHADFIAAPLNVCAFAPVNYTDLSTSAWIPPTDEWLWDFGDGVTSGSQNPMHVYADTGYFNVTLIAYNNGCPDTLVRPKYIYVRPPVSKFKSTPDCNNRKRVTFTDQSIVPLTWAWDFGDGSPIDNSQNPVHIFPSFGIFNVTLTTTNGSCSHSLGQLVHVIDESPNFAAIATVACKEALISFQTLNVTYTNITNYDWDFGDGGNGSTTNPSTSYLYKVTGNFDVRLITTDINGCLDTVIKTNYIRINGPTAKLSASNARGCAGLKATFNDLSTTDGVNSIVKWTFDFGDGNVQNFTAPPFEHVYSTPGIFNVQLKVTDASGCIDSLTLVDTVHTSDPDVFFDSPQVLTCPGSLVAFTNYTIALPGFSSYWEFGDGNTSTAFQPTTTYNATGYYDVKLRIVDSYGCADSLTRKLFIRVDSPVASFNVSDTAGACIPIEVTFTNTSNYYNTVKWDFGLGEGTSTLSNPVHYYSRPGIYTAHLQVTSPGGCVSDAFRTITVYDTSGSKVTYAPIAGCKPLTFNISTNTVGFMSSYFWDFGDGNTVSTNTPNATHIYTSFGNFLPKLIMEDPAGCQIPIQGPDTVYVIGGNPKFGMDKRLLCDSGIVSFTDSTRYNDPVIQYSWDFGDGGSASVQNPVYHYSSPGNYNVAMGIVTQSGCKDTARIPIAVKVVQSPLIDIGGPDVICIGAPLKPLGVFLQPDTSLVKWSWTFPNGNTSILQNPLGQIYNTAGNFVVTTIATNSSGCKDTATQNLVVNPLPTVTLPGTITVQPGFPVTIPATYSNNVNTWAWSPSLGLSCTDCPTPDAGPKFNTTYQVFFTDQNSCSNIGTVKVIVICKEGNLFIPNTFSPNGDGNNDVFYPRGTGLYSIKVLRIFNRWGEVVFEKRDFPANDPLAGWNGTVKGKKPQADVYVYQAEVFCENGDLIRLNGNIALIL
jgi:gliding motility-associated-like protein